MQLTLCSPSLFSPSKLHSSPLFSLVGRGVPQQPQDLQPAAGKKGALRLPLPLPHVAFSRFLATSWPLSGALVAPENSHSFCIWLRRVVWMCRCAMKDSRPDVRATAASALAESVLVALALVPTGFRRADASYNSGLKYIQKTRVRSLHKDRHCRSRSPGQQDLTDLGLRSVVLSRTGRETAVGRCYSLCDTSLDP